MPETATALPTGAAPGGSAPVLPLLGARPLKPTIGVQRSTTPDVEPALLPASGGPPWGSATRAPVTGSMPTGLPVPAAWPAEDGGLSLIDGSPFVAPPVTPSRWTAPSVSAAPAPGHGPAARPSVQRAAGPSVASRTWAPAAPAQGQPFPSVGSAPDWPTLESSAPDRAPSARPAPAASAATGPRTAGETPLPLARSSAAAPGPATAGGTPPVVARLVAGPSAPVVTVQAGPTAPAGPAVQAPVTTVTATPVVQRVDGAAPAPGGSAPGHTEPELDELARALFGRIRTHLRSEVIHEREARGLTFDPF